MFLRVAQFHRTFNQLVSDTPQFPTSSIRDLRYDLLQEEVNEFCHACKTNDIIEQADALADMCYIIAGTCVSYGICPEGVYESPYDNVKRPWAYHQMQIFYNLKPSRIAREDFDTYHDAEASNNLNNVRDSLMTMMANIFGLGLHLGIPLNQVFTEVHRSNMAKALPDGTVRYRPDGKVLKPDGWTPPDIKGVLLSSGWFEEVSGFLCPK